MPSVHPTDVALVMGVAMVFAGVATQEFTGALLGLAILSLPFFSYTYSRLRANNEGGQ